jgi:hypothetical protein
MHAMGNLMRISISRRPRSQNKQNIPTSERIENTATSDTMTLLLPPAYLCFGQKVPDDFQWLDIHNIHLPRDLCRANNTARKHISSGKASCITYNHQVYMHRIVPLSSSSSSLALPLLFAVLHEQPDIFHNCTRNA